MQTDTDVLILGAGAAGLSAAVELANAGMRVSILEARDRIGGRMFTIHDSAANASIELGAEFIHGLAPEIWETVQRENITVHEMEGENWCAREGKLSRCESIPDVDKLLNKLDAKGPDEFFVQFIDRCCPNVSPEAKRWAFSYISGFHAADPALISVHSLVFGMRADEQIEGERSFRLQHGYQALLDVLHRRVVAARVPIHLNTVVEMVQWREGECIVTVSSEEGVVKTLAAPRVLVTLPLGVLQAEEGTAGAVRFLPHLPAMKQKALGHLAMGKVARVTLQFDERFWDRIQPASSHSMTLADAGFLFSQEEWFPTWWTTVPLKLPIITGWSPSSWAVRLAGQTEGFVVDKALTALGNLMGVERRELDRRLRASHWHDWQSDPFTRGAYSYVTVGGDTAQRDLGRPLENALFFAGEATDVTGHNGTVHGAMASGRRAAQDILLSR